MSTSSSTTLETIASLCKRRGFVYQSADIYGSLNGVYDYGHLGVIMKDNIKKAWKRSINQIEGAILFFDGALLGPQAVWEASGHVQHFHDPLVDCMHCKKRYRADDVDLHKPCPHCGITKWTDVRQFNMMFKTHAGALADHGSTAYLRPETAQSIFANFKNIVSSNRVKLPFGVAQIGKAFRNEITPKQFLFRMREFEQMELEWFCEDKAADHFFEQWIALRQSFYTAIGITPVHIRLHPHSPTELAHYSKQCTDIEYQFPFGFRELEGIADRGIFDLSQHTQHSGKDLSMFNDIANTTVMPHIIECSVGVDRLFIAILFEAYTQDTLGGEERIVLRLHPSIAPIKAAFLPLTKKISEPMLRIYTNIKKELAPYDYHVEFDDSGSIGKRYRRHDEIGTPFCFTYDFESEQDEQVTVRDRDTLKQERIAFENIQSYIHNKIR